MDDEARVRLRGRRLNRALRASISNQRGADDGGEEKCERDENARSVADFASGSFGRRDDHAESVMRSVPSGPPPPLSPLPAVFFWPPRGPPPGEKPPPAPPSPLKPGDKNATWLGGASRRGFLVSCAKHGKVSRPPHEDQDRDEIPPRNRVDNVPLALFDPRQKQPGPAPAPLIQVRGAKPHCMASRSAFRSSSFHRSPRSRHQPFPGWPLPRRGPAHGDDPDEGFVAEEPADREVEQPVPLAAPPPAPWGPAGAGLRPSIEHAAEGVGLPLPLAPHPRHERFHHLSVSRRAADGAPPPRSAESALDRVAISTQRPPPSGADRRSRGRAVSERMRGHRPGTSAPGDRAGRAGKLPAGLPVALP